MTKWVVDNLAKVLVVALFIVVMVLLFSVHSCNQARDAKAGLNVARSQAGAATASGADAVATVGNRADDEAAIDAISRTNGDAIRNAEGADATVAPAARDAALRSLCARAAYRGDPKCL